MLEIRNLLRGATIAAAVLMIAFAASSLADDIVSEWDSVKPPPKPELKPVTVEPSTTALLIMDIMKQNCGVRPRCMATVPNIKRLHDGARAAGISLSRRMMANGRARPAQTSLWAQTSNRSSKRAVSKRPSSAALRFRASASALAQVWHSAATR
jgi:hypothetical protein